MWDAKEVCTLVFIIYHRSYFTLLVGYVDEKRWEFYNNMDKDHRSMKHAENFVSYSSQFVELVILFVSPGSIGFSECLLSWKIYCYTHSVCTLPDGGTVNSVGTTHLCGHGSRGRTSLVRRIAMTSTYLQWPSLLTICTDCPLNLLSLISYTFEVKSS